MQCGSRCESSGSSGREEWEAVEGTALVTAMPTVQLAELRDVPYVRYGDRLRLEGALTSPPELDGFDYQAYLSRQGIGSVMFLPEIEPLGEGRWVAAGVLAVRRPETLVRNVA